MNRHLRHLDMGLIMKGLGVILLLCAVSGKAAGQTTDSTFSQVFIDSISIEGNRKTRDALILRELDFQIGDSLSLESLGATLDRNALRLMNLGIFNRARINVRQWREGNHLSLHIELTESWYLYPVPIFSLADRNFNVWWHEFHRSLRRVNYGVDFTQLNFTGRADALKINAQFGYSNRYEINYRVAGINRRQTVGLNSGISYTRSHEVAVTTSGNKLVFQTDAEVWNIRRTSAWLGFTWRPRLLTTQNFTLEYHDNRVADTVAAELNPDFFGNGRTHQRHSSLIYTLEHDRRDMRPYPTKGWYAYAELRINGLLPSDDLHLVRLKTEYGRYFPLTKKISFEAIGKVRVSLPHKKPPYFNNQALGYGGDYIRGYEYYVADGLDYAMLRTSWHWMFFNFDFNFGRHMPVKAFRRLPLKLFLALNADTGYANDPYYAAFNPLSNRILYGYGFGLDIVAYYNKTARFEWTWNHLGEGGFYLRINTGI